MASDIFQAAQAQTSSSQREALAALARGGSAEKDAFLAGIKAQQEDRQRMLQEILSRSTQINAPEGLQAELAAKSQPGFDRRAAALAASQGSAQSALDQMTKAHSNYFTEVDAAVPILRARSDEINAAAKAKAEQEQQDRDLRYQLAQMQLARSGLDYDTAAAKAAADRAKAASGGDLSDSELRTRLLGAGEARQAAIPKPLQNLSVLGVKLSPSRTALARQAGMDAGIDPTRVLGLTQPKPPAAPKPRTPSQQLSDREAKAQLDRLNLLDTAKRAASKGTYFELEKAIDVGEEAQSLQAALDYVNGLKADYLKRNGISRTALLDWVKRYGSI